MKKVFFLFIMVLVLTAGSAQELTAAIEGIFTTLVIIEETENNINLVEERPLSDGIFEALWDKNDYIFFDMVAEKPLGFIEEDLDVKPYLQSAYGSGADSVLLIKLNLFSDETNDVTTITLNDYSYHLYSILNMKSVLKGKINLDTNKVIDKNDKYKILKEIGKKIITQIYQ